MQKQQRNLIRALTQLTIKEWIFSLLIAGTVFLALGTLTALWKNPFFIRMTAIGPLDFVLLFFESLLVGLFFGIRTVCSIKKAGTGGVFGFLGFACSICNQLLVFVFGTGFLLTYFEPVRLYVGTFGIILLSYALYQKLLLRLPPASV